MFGSKHLLIAFVIGSVGFASLYIGVSELENLKVGQFAVGVTLLWVSALFGGFIAGREMAGKSESDDEKP